ncbi:MAG: phage gp6-like head-tail connector protein [Bacteroidales bacterium]|nr:phage gp6-like head-tail connector protein [Bacteroidales bacterium]MBD5235143.1 phage gp6-like head-tail connector protein [Barnesiella sp.]MBD5257386.1 phage gp6-like head-tail connector protein [Barnesiella sp.]
MKNYLTLDLVKKHLNIDADYHGDDGYIVWLINAAQDVVAHHIDEDIENLIVSDNGREDLPPAIVQAILLYIGTLYAQRESISYGSVIEVPFAYDYLLSLYKRYNGPGKKL